MVLRPLAPAPVAACEQSSASITTAWSVVAERQECSAAGYWLISQPDHANLSGDLAANFVSSAFPRVDPLVARAIGVHDSGWALFPHESNPSEPPLLSQEGKPLAFVEFQPTDFVRAWTASIDRAEGVCPAGGAIVSRHFFELGTYRLAGYGGWLGEDDRQLITSFLEREKERQQRLVEISSGTIEELNAWLAVLQFCDLLSLYLCSGARQEAEFPQQLTDRPVRVSRPRGEDFYRLDPSPFQPADGNRAVSLGVTARYYPNEGPPKLTTLAFLLT
jgi:hypothetical protein